METVIRKWGNSAAVRLPSSAMKSASFDMEQPVLITATKGRIVIEPVTQVEFQLGDLLAGVTPGNAHSEVDFGAPVGKEAF